MTVGRDGHGHTGCWLGATFLAVGSAGLAPMRHLKRGFVTANTGRFAFTTFEQQILYITVAYTPIRGWFPGSERHSVQPYQRSLLHEICGLGRHQHKLSSQPTTRKRVYPIRNPLDSLPCRFLIKVGLHGPCCHAFSTLDGVCRQQLSPP